MSWADLDTAGPAAAAEIRVTQSKTGARLWIPLHRALRAALAQAPRTALKIVTAADGRPITRGAFDHQWRQALRALDLAGRTFHGLRYSAAANLAEAGCSDRQIAAITGHASTAMLTKYTKAAKQRRLAQAAIAKLEEHGD